MREGAYAEAFLYFRMTISSKSGRLSADAAKAYSLKVELVESTAISLCRMNLGTKFALLARSKAVTLASIVEIDYEVGAQGIILNMLPSNDNA